VKQLIKIGRAPMPEKIGVTELASWTDVCRAVLNLQETMTRY
jgi:hypothetical protein